jgi:FtsH-binding integral membrane protein
MGLGFRASQLGLGQVSDPGPGFTIFLAAAVLAALSVMLVVSSLWFPKNEAGGESDAIRWGKIGLILVSLIAYGLVLRKLGFVLSTFLLVVIFLRVIERKNWSAALLSGVAMSLGTYVVFDWLLQARLPRGILGF